MKGWDGGSKNLSLWLSPSLDMTCKPCHYFINVLHPLQFLKKIFWKIRASVLQYIQGYPQRMRLWRRSKTHSVFCFGIKSFMAYSMFRKREKSSLKKCLGSGSVGSPRFWLSESGSAKICGSTYPDPRGKISTKNCNKQNLTLKAQIWNIEKRELIQISWFLNGLSSS